MCLGPEGNPNNHVITNSSALNDLYNIQSPNRNDLCTIIAGDSLVCFMPSKAKYNKEEKTNSKTKKTNKKRPVSLFYSQKLFHPHVGGHL